MIMAFIEAHGFRTIKSSVSWPSWLMVMSLFCANQITAQKLWTPQGIARISDYGVVLDTDAGERFLTLNEREVDIAYMCGLDDWLFVLRTSGYEYAPLEYGVEISEILKVNLLSGAEEKLTFESTLDLTEEEHLRNLTPPFTLSSDYYFDGSDEGAVAECFSCTKVTGLPATRIDAGCTYPYLYITIPAFRAADYLYRYNVVNDESAIISLDMNPRLIHDGPLRGNLVTRSTMITEHGRQFQDRVIDSEGTEIKEMGSVHNWGSQFDGIIDLWTDKSSMRCTNCVPNATPQGEDLPVDIIEGRVDFNGTLSSDSVDKIAILPLMGIDCNGNEKLGLGIARYVEGVLLDRYDIVERQDIDVLLQEQKLSLSGLIDEQTTVEAGKNIGADGVVTVQTGCANGAPTIYVKLIDSETSEIYWSCTGIGMQTVDFVDALKSHLHN